MVAVKKTVERVIDTYRRAAAANSQCGSRHGNLVQLSPEIARDVMVTADVHGNRVHFNRIGALAALDRHPRRHLIMQEVCHGGPLYPSGNGCMSHTLLEDVARLKTEYPERFHFLLSNHELAELTDFPIVKSKKLLNLLFRCGLQEMYGTATEQVRGAALEFIRSLPLAVRLASGVFVSHSSPEKLDEQPFDAQVLDRALTTADLVQGGAAFRLVWGRDFRAENAHRFAQLVDAELLIQGHEPCRDGYRVPNDIQIILDSCCRKACYVILPTDRKLTQAQIVERIARL